jgi:predicted ATPase
MVSDALCVFPRICEPLSDIVFQKTKGNPYFVVAFLRSLVDRGLLNYCVNARRWLWDEDDVSAMDVTGNVLHLLSFKMSGLSTSIRSALKTAACFGIKIEQCVITALSADPKHEGIKNLLEEVVNEGFMFKVGTSHFRFVHDKVREAAYSLISDEEKNQVSKSMVVIAFYCLKCLIQLFSLNHILPSKYHYNIGKSLYLATKGKEMEDKMLLFIADQMVHRIVNMEDECPELRIDIANIYYLSGMKAVGYSDYATSRAYFKVALSLLPTDRWESQHKLCHRISLRLAKSVYSLGDVDEAQSILHEMLEKCLAIEDKLPVQALLVKSEY